MGITLFVFGLPGSGKSAAARQIKSSARKKHFRPRRFRDYTILYRMFQDDQEANSEVKRFRSTKSYSEYDGFDVLDFGAFDEALQKLHHNIVRRKNLLTKILNCLSSNSPEMIIAKLFPFFLLLGCMMHTSFLSILT